MILYHIYLLSIHLPLITMTILNTTVKIVNKYFNNSAHSF